MLKLGYKASAEQFAPRELLDFSCLAEEVGFDSIFVSDHFQPWKHTDGHAPSALAWLGALGAKTSRAQIGTNPRNRLDTLARLRAGLERLHKLTREAGRDPKDVGLAYRFSQFGAIPERADNGDRRLGSRRDRDRDRRRARRRRRHTIDQRY